MRDMMSGRFNPNNAYTKTRPAPRKDPYRRQDTRVEYQIFGSEYFSGADVHLYLGDIWIDEITEFDFVLQEEVLPVFGYHSYTADTFARGKRTIAGHFNINFKSVGYLQEILKHRDAIEYAIEQGKQGLGNPKILENYKLDEVLKLFGKSRFIDVAEEYEKAIWGEEGADLSYLAQRNRPYFQADDKEGFDIRIHYGSVSDTERNLRFYQRTLDPKPNLTVETLNGVQIYSVSKRMSTMDQGAPLQERYQFVARDLNASPEINFDEDW